MVARLLCNVFLVVLAIWFECSGGHLFVGPLAKVSVTWEAKVGVGDDGNLSIVRFWIVLAIDLRPVIPKLCAGNKKAPKNISNFLHFPRTRHVNY